MENNKQQVVSKKPGTFAVGNRAAAGRARNHITRDLKEGIVDAAIATGEDGKGKGGLAGYLQMLARRYPKQYTTLLARVIPLQVTGTMSQFIGAVNIVPIPADRYLSGEQMRELNPLQEAPTTVIIENDAEENAA